MTRGITLPPAVHHRNRRTALRRQERAVPDGTAARRCRRVRIPKRHRYQARACAPAQPADVHREGDDHHGEEPQLKADGDPPSRREGHLPRRRPDRSREALARTPNEGGRSALDCSGSAAVCMHSVDKHDSPPAPLDDVEAVRGSVQGRGPTLPRLPDEADAALQGCDASPDGRRSRVQARRDQLVPGRDSATQPSREEAWTPD